MLTEIKSKPSVILFPEADPPRLELNRLLAAAVVNRQFCQLLLNDPAAALAEGYLGEAFRLAEEERRLLLALRAESLPELAQQLLDALHTVLLPQGALRS